MLPNDHHNDLSDRDRIEKKKKKFNQSELLTNEILLIILLALDMISNHLRISVIFVTFLFSI